MGLRFKIVSGFLILTAMLFIAGIWSIYELNTVGTSVQKLLDENYKSINAARTMVEALEREDSGVLLLISGNRLEGRKILASGDSLFRHGLDIASKNLTISGEKSYVDSIRIKYERYKSLWEQTLPGSQKESYLNAYFQTIHHAFLEVKSSIHSLSNLNSDVMFKTASKLQDKANRAIMPGIVAIIAALVFSLLFSYFVNHYMINPIVKITGRVKQFVEKKLPFEVEIETRDELSDLENSIQTLCNLVKTPESKS